MAHCVLTHSHCCVLSLFQSKDICTQLQDGLLKVTTELQTVSENPFAQNILQFFKETKASIALCVSVQGWRTYYQYHSDYVCAEGKLKEAERQEEKQKQSAKKLERLIEKVNEYCLCNLMFINVYTYLFNLLLMIVSVLQRQGKVQDIYLKCSKARNEYLLNLAAANASMNKYYLQDISTLIDVSG